jgi:5-formyltetrahydrofolate cyclo-ligase
MARDGTGGRRHPPQLPAPGTRMAQSTAEVRAARRRLRRLRAALDPDERAAAERAIHRTLDRLHIFRRGRRVALYLPMPGEVDVRRCLEAAWQRGAAVFVPRISSRRRGRMTFVSWAPGIAQRRNAFGIAEPQTILRRAPALQLDAVVLPVVGFDRRGNRLGMGAGFYDRALRRRLDPARCWRRPRLIGVAFACQELEAIPVSPWDVPLDLIVTERGLVVPERRPNPEECE